MDSDVEDAIYAQMYFEEVPSAVESPGRCSMLIAFSCTSCCQVLSVTVYMEVNVVRGYFLFLFMCLALEYLCPSSQQMKIYCTIHCQ